jgi:hypothetical protein
MTIQELELKVASASEKVEKIKKTISKHEAGATKRLDALIKKEIGARNWKDDGFYDLSYEDKTLVQDYDQKLDDAKGATRKLKDAEVILANWITKLDTEINKEKFLNDNAPEVIKEFLEQWKKKSYAWYIEMYPKYQEDKKTFQIGEADAKAEYIKQNPKGRTWSSEAEKFIEQYLKDNDIKATYLTYPPIVKAMSTYSREDERLAYLEKELESDKRYKMLDLIYRVTDVVGTITDASKLKISNVGNLNGFIIGEKGSAKVETIGAGGYNIQCFHFRTLVHKL